MMKISVFIPCYNKRETILQGKKSVVFGSHFLGTGAYCLSGWDRQGTLGLTPANYDGEGGLGCSTFYKLAASL